MVQRGIHVTNTISDVECLLSKDGDRDVIVTERCVEHLVSEGYTVVLVRRRTIITEQLVEVEVTRSGNGHNERIVKDTVKTNTYGVGKWRLE